MTLKQQTAKSEKEIQLFNSKYPIGTNMYLQLDNGELIEITTYAKASIVSCMAVGWPKIDGVDSSCWLLERFKPLK